MIGGAGFPTLRTPRLVLEPFEAKHSPGMFALWSSPEVCRYSGEAEDLQGRPIPLPATRTEDSDRILEFFIARMARPDAVRWAIVEDGAFVGALGFNSLPQGAGAWPELAFHLLPPRWGQGLAREASEAVLAWGETALGPEGFEAFADDPNVASGALLERLGFERTDELREGARRYQRALT